MSQHGGTGIGRVLGSGLRYGGIRGGTNATPVCVEHLLPRHAVELFDDATFAPELDLQTIRCRRERAARINARK
jgi:hypothetical protein